MSFESVRKKEQGRLCASTADPCSFSRNSHGSSRTGDCLTPRTSDSSNSSNNNITTTNNNILAHKSPGKGKIQEQHQQSHSSGLGPGVMVPPDVVQAIKDGTRPQRAGGGNKMDADALHSEIVEKDIAERFDVVTDGIEKLENVFSGAAQILEHRVRAITTISR